MAVASGVERKESDQLMNIKLDIGGKSVNLGEIVEALKLIEKNKENGIVTKDKEVTSEVPKIKRNSSFTFRSFRWSVYGLLWIISFVYLTMLVNREKFCGILQEDEEI